MADNETIMDTIRKIRAEADSIEESARGSLKAGETWDGRPFTESDLEAALDLAERKRKEADRLEAAHKREIDALTEKLDTAKHCWKVWSDRADELLSKCNEHFAKLKTLKSDPDWKDICAKCKEGDIEPKDCEYYGEPNGCNSPIYGEHPTTKKSLVVGNAAKLREALLALKELDFNKEEDCYDFYRIIDAALAAPPRNCDVGTAEEQEKRYNEWLNADVGRAVLGLDPLEWAQMPYEEGGCS